MNHLDKNLKRKYAFVEYDPAWATQFNSIKGRVAEIFKGKALAIEHIGSTSIPGMKAKPLIDVLVVVTDIKDLSQEAAAMTRLGYEWGENYIAPDTLLFFNVGPDGKKLENIHVCESGAPKERQFLIMRDYLRTFPDKVQEYSRIKEANYLNHPDDYPAYRAAKAPYLAALEQEAYAWNEGRA